jgi:hypothetical protein
MQLVAGSVKFTPLSCIKLLKDASQSGSSLPSSLLHGSAKEQELVDALADVGVRKSAAGLLFNQQCTLMPELT